MKNLLFVSALLISAAHLSAQQTTSTTVAAQDPVKTEMRAISGSLKESLGQVDQQLMSVNKQLSVAAPETSAALQTSKTELTSAKSELETALTLVNTATPAQWPDVKAKAQALNERVAALITGLKK